MLAYLFAVSLLRADAAVVTPEKLDFAEPGALYVSIAAVDLWSTWAAEGNGAVEGNPWMRSRPIEKKAALSIGLWAGDVALQAIGRKHRWLRWAPWVYRALVVGLHVPIFITNFRNAAATR